MLAARVPSAKAEALRKYLQRKGLLSSKYRVFSGGEFIYFPLQQRTGESSDAELRRFGAKLVRRRLELQHEKRAHALAQGYELYGSIAVIECEPSEARSISRSLLRANKNVKTVLRKGGAVSGRYRTRKFLFVAGARNYIADYMENGCTFRFDIRKVFFSTKLGYERKRISEMVKEGEKVLVMFAGVGPYAIEIAKSHRSCKVVAIEYNSAACACMRKNIALNKTANVTAEQGDVSRFSRKYAGFADRIIMPLPKEAESYLPVALKMSKRKCTVHLYSFCESGKVTEQISRIRRFVMSRRRGFRLLSHRSVRPYSASEIELVIDFAVEQKRL